MKGRAARFPGDQLYIVFAFSDGGTDLEHIQLQSAAEAHAMLLQVTVALAVAEEAMQFEHRDLHWAGLWAHHTPATPSTAFLDPRLLSQMASYDILSRTFSGHSQDIVTSPQDVL